MLCSQECGIQHSSSKTDIIMTVGTWLKGKTSSYVHGPESLCPMTTFEENLQGYIL